jgi:hypothetical protein
MPTTPLFPLPEGLEMTSLSETPDELLVRVISYRSSSPCPHCSTLRLPFTARTAGIPRICLARVVPFDWCSRSASSFVAIPPVRAKCSQNGFQIFLKLLLA